jgi:hypothetical protein
MVKGGSESEIWQEVSALATAHVLMALRAFLEGITFSSCDNAKDDERCQPLELKVC